MTGLENMEVKMEGDRSERWNAIRRSDEEEYVACAAGVASWWQAVFEMYGGEGPVGTYMQMAGDEDELRGVMEEMGYGLGPSVRWLRRKRQQGFKERAELMFRRLERGERVQTGRGVKVEVFSYEFIDDL